MKLVRGCMLTGKLIMILTLFLMLTLLSLLKEHDLTKLAVALDVNTARAQPTRAAQQQRNPDAPLPPINLGELEFTD